MWVFLNYFHLLLIYCLFEEVLLEWRKLCGKIKTKAQILAGTCVTADVEAHFPDAMILTYCSAL